MALPILAKGFRGVYTKICMRMLALLLIFPLSLFAQSYYPSPSDWAQQSIYFLVLDRFANGDTSNDDLGKGEYNPEDVDFYHGGDIQGMIDKLDYLKSLGITAIWHTPVVHNQWLSPTYGRSRYSGYHGYWAYDFYNVDPHFGTLELYKKFVQEAHRRGIYVIQDIVVNHMGDFYSEDGKVLVQDGFPNRPAPPFAEVEKAQHYFNFNGTTLYTRGFGNTLDDLKTTNPEVRRKLIDIFKFWIRETNIDGYRIDTVKYVECEFWLEFIPEILAYARSLGKNNFIIFGEVYDYDNLVAFKLDEADASVAAYTWQGEASLFPSMLDFSVSAAITKTIVGTTLAGSPLNREGQPLPGRLGSFQLIADRFRTEVNLLYSAQAVSQRITFIDNHDMPRFLHATKANGDWKKLQLALLLLYTLPGVPQLYYGTEQGFVQPRARKGTSWGSENRQDLWDSGYRTDTELFRYVQRLNALRTTRSELARGWFVPLLVDGPYGNLFVYRRSVRNNQLVVVINRGTMRQRVELRTWLPQGGVDLLTERTTGASVEVEPQSGLVLAPKQ
jgi:glycosidase